MSQLQKPRLVAGKVAFNIGLGMGAAPDLETNVHGMIGGSIGDASAPTVPDLGSVRSAMTEQLVRRSVRSTCRDPFRFHFSFT